MLEALGREYYLTGAGLKRDPGFERIYQHFGDLLGEEALDAARASESRELLEWLVGVRIGRKTAPLDEQQLVWEQNAVLKINGQEIGYLRAPIELANSPDRDYRIALDTARSRQGAAGLDGIRRDRFMLEREEMSALGYGDYVQAVSALSGIDLDALGQRAAAFLDATAEIYADGLARLVRARLGLTLGQLVRADAPWTFRADGYDGAFPAERLLETAQHQMSEMGLDAAQEGRVRFDTEEREGKQPRAFCVPVRVPEEVYLVLQPHGGHSDYRTFWHELGHAMHFSSPSRELSFAARWLGDNSVTEGFAMLWDHVTLDSAWLRRYTALAAGDTRNLAFELGVHELHMVRRYAAKLLYELSLYRSDLTALGPEYADRLTEATLFRYSEEDHLADVDPGFYAARYLRAWQLEAALAATLTERFDEDWYRNPEAGAFIRELMGRGQTDPADQLASELTGADLAFDQLAQRLEQLLA